MIFCFFSHTCIQTDALQAVYFCTREEVFDSLMALRCRMEAALKVYGDI